MYLSRDLTTDQNCNIVPRSDLCVKPRYEASNILKTISNEHKICLGSSTCKVPHNKGPLPNTIQTNQVIKFTDNLAFHDIIHTKVEYEI